MRTIENCNLGSNENDSVGLNFTRKFVPPLKVKLSTSR